MIDTLGALLSTPAIAYVLLIVLFVEAIALFWVWKDKKIGVPPLQVITFLGSGVAFGLALWCVLAQAGAIWLAICLCAAFILHIMDLKLRWSG